MADRYLLESGSPDGYQLEDGSGVLLLDIQSDVAVGRERSTFRHVFGRVWGRVGLLLLLVGASCTL